MAKTVAVVVNDGIRETLFWDDVGDVFTVSRTFQAVGHTSTETLTEEATRDLLQRWAELDQLDDGFSVERVDEYLADIIMEGEEWHPLKPTTHSTSDD